MRDCLGFNLAKITLGQRISPLSEQRPHLGGPIARIGE